MDFFNEHVDLLKKQTGKVDIDEFIDSDSRKISWTEALKSHLVRQKKIDVNDGRVTTTIYRPFSRQSLYYSRRLNERINQTPGIFPCSSAFNLVIQVSGIGARSGFSTLMTDRVPSLDTIEKGQCFPLYLYRETRPDDDFLDSRESETDGFIRRDAITDKGIAIFRNAYPGEEISRKNLFYYIYGLLHSPEYRARFKNNLAKALPRIPPVRTYADFIAFRDAGKCLGDLHVNFESVEPYMLTFREGNHNLIFEAQSDPEKFYRVRKMKFGGTGKEKDRTTVIYNDHITMENIPLDAYDYMVNGKPALQWVIDRQCVRTDRASGIINDANDYANEIAGDPRYPLELFQRVITVSLETMKVVRGLPGLDIDA